MHSPEKLTTFSSGLCKRLVFLLIFFNMLTSILCEVGGPFSMLPDNVEDVVAVLFSLEAVVRIKVGYGDYRTRYIVTRLEAK